MSRATGQASLTFFAYCSYVAASIGLANTGVYWLLVVLRCVQASGSASVISIGSGTIGDISPPSERGGFMALSSLGIMAGPAWAPVVGGLLAGRYGWQSIFWFLTVLGSFVLLVMFVALPEVRPVGTLDKGCLSSLALEFRRCAPWWATGLFQLGASICHWSHGLVHGARPTAMPLVSSVYPARRLGGISTPLLRSGCSEKRIFFSP